MPDVRYIQRLIDEAKPGETVTIPAGTYMVPKGGLRLPRDVNLHGATSDGPCDPLDGSAPPADDL